MAKPLGVVLLAVYSAVSGVVQLVGAYSVSTLLANYPGFITAGFTVLLFFAVWAFTTAYGIWMYQSWGWYLLLAACIFSVPFSFAWIYFDPTTDNIVAGVLTTMISAAIAAYLLTAPMKKLYITGATKTRRGVVSARRR